MDGEGSRCVGGVAHKSFAPTLESRVVKRIKRHGQRRDTENSSARLTDRQASAWELHDRQAGAGTTGRLFCLSVAPIREDMNSVGKLAGYICCPVCKGDLTCTDYELVCNECSRRYVLQDKVPILVATDNSLFGRRDLATMSSAGFHSSVLMKVGRFIPSPTFNYSEERLWKKVVDTAMQIKLNRCLIIGSGDDESVVDRMKPLFAEVVVTDVVSSPGVECICDASQLPFKAGSFDCVILIAVLEHVLEPQVVVEEAYRALAEGGLIVSSTPFMQQVHMRQYDFTRFTDLGHRWLFRKFVELERGVAAGPASALVWSWVYFWRAFAPNRAVGLVLSSLVRLCFFWMKYLDLLLKESRGSYDASAGYYFVGRKNEGYILTAGELVADFRGL